MSQQDFNTNVIHRKRRSADAQDDQVTEQIRVYEFYESKIPPMKIHNQKEALEAKDLANDTFFYEKLEASIPKLKENEKDDVEQIKNNKSFSTESYEGDYEDESDEKDELEENEENEENIESEKSSLAIGEENAKKDAEFVQNPEGLLKEVEEAFNENNRYINKQQENIQNDDRPRAPKTKKFSKDFDSAGELFKEVHSLLNKKINEPDETNHSWKIEYQNPIV